MVEGDDEEGEEARVDWTTGEDEKTPDAEGIISVVDCADTLDPVGFESRKKGQREKGGDAISG